MFIIDIGRENFARVVFHHKFEKIDIFNLIAESIHISYNNNIPLIHIIIILYINEKIKCKIGKQKG